MAFARTSRRELTRARPPADVLGTFGVMSPPDGVLWVQSVHKVWLQVSGRERGFTGRLRQRVNLFHPLILAMERNHIGRRKYRRLIALTDQVKQDLMRLYAVPGEDVDILPNGFAPAEFNVGRRRQSRSFVRAQLGYGDGDRVVLFAANELERKGFGPLLRAIASLNDPRIALLAVGRHNARTYAAEIKRLGLSERVRFTGPASDVAAYYAAADVFALPTQYEAWGLVIVEAMACGLPVLTSRVAGAAVAVKEGETGALLDTAHDPAEIAAKLVPLLDGAHVPADQVAESVAGYAWDRILDRYERILAACAVPRRGRGSEGVSR
jgi:UDP-glucose:(heptosyl)LPS alpha-1,3-glucosyltransferase